MGHSKLSRNTPWLVVFLLGMAFNWLWFWDAKLRPAVTVDHDRTVTLNLNREPQDSFQAEEPVLVRGYGVVHRSCPREYHRSLEFPNGQRQALVSGYGVRFEPGSEGEVVVRIDTFPDWPAGLYKFRTTGHHSCNGELFPAQTIPGFRADFRLE